VDYGKKTVDGYAARVTDVETTWATVETDTARVWFTEHTLNRLAGTYQNFTRDVMYAGPPVLYNSEKAPAQKF
jgi:hypothetical protein